MSVYVRVSDAVVEFCFERGVFVGKCVLPNLIKGKYVIEYI